MTNTSTLSARLRDEALGLPLPIALWSSGGQVVFPVYGEDGGLEPEWFCAYLFCPVPKIDAFSAMPPPVDMCTWFAHCFDPEKQTMGEAANALVRDIESKTGRKFPRAN